MPARVDDATRKAAHDAWIAACGHRRTAIKILKGSPGVTKQHAWGKLIKRHGEDFSTRHSFADKSRPGRPSHLTQAALERATAIIKAGFKFDSMQRVWLSSPQAFRESAELRSIAEEARLTHAHLFTRIQEAAPELQYAMQQVKQSFNMKQKRDRQRSCRGHLRKSARFRKRVFWIDAKKMYVQASRLKAWLDTSETIPTVSDQRCEGRTVLHFYAMVNAVGGAVALKYVTGTSDLKGGQQYKVRTFFSIHPCLPQMSHATSASLICMPDFADGRALK